ncbi:D-2-hydroxyacid dehydrogenase family protein [Candidatus Entotheonella palauensis]|uniref:2-hydroxyacid dehydrogenase n=1 Tax=Candidatus Entotheonella gemina TaxID=1429439 RepID=W4MBS0_9BACT|nr:D-2-hydroxyacid dehydrogenase family protein [Candidatus Entotheonella palauensis]ETX07336.1 MAG: 2-hydroxyacid dehydrogenase [Candidatus Entotheonella gemina]
MTRVALLDDYQDAALQMADWQSLPADVEVQVFRDHLSDEDALVERLKDINIIMAMRERTPFQRSLLQRLPNLKLLITAGMRNASIDLQAASDCGVMVCGTEGLGYPTAELTWGLILSLMRRIPHEDRATRNGQWQVTTGLGLQGKTLGLMGLGRLGSQVAAVGKAFQMNLIAWSQNLTAERAAEYDATLVSKDELMAQSDILSVHLILSDRTRGLIGARELGMMKPTAYLVNTSRGPIVDEPALIQALEDGTIAGAGLDVFDVEPLPLDHPFRRLDNLVITPHIGYVTDETYRVFYGDALEDIHAFLKGEPIRVLNPGS